ncbi:hypothetical protein TNCV_2263331 [Trichonephila clavipes]|nr:hypothetical protein TNCV_2263331 [Trichonephila clavipes]
MYENILNGKNKSIIAIPVSNENRPPSQYGGYDPRLVRVCVRVRIPKFVDVLLRDPVGKLGDSGMVGDMRGKNVAIEMVIEILSKVYSTCCKDVTTDNQWDQASKLNDSWLSCEPLWPSFKITRGCKR